jgi:hypothetical protein
MPKCSQTAPAQIAIDRLAEQFAKQAEDAESLLMWIINAENIVIVEAND